MWYKCSTKIIFKSKISTQLYTVVMTGITIAGKYLIKTANYEDVGRYTPAMDTLKDICFYLNLVQCFVGVFFSILVGIN